jgi:hypothetical protein
MPLKDSKSSLGRLIVKVAFQTRMVLIGTTLQHDLISNFGLPLRESGRFHSQCFMHLEYRPMLFFCNKKHFKMRQWLKDFQARHFAKQYKRRDFGYIFRVLLRHPAMGGLQRDKKILKVEPTPKRDTTGWGSRLIIKLDAEIRRNSSTGFSRE